MRHNSAVKLGRRCGCPALWMLVDIKFRCVKSWVHVRDGCAYGLKRMSDVRSRRSCGAVLRVVDSSQVTLVILSSARSWRHRRTASVWRRPCADCRPGQGQPGTPRPSLLTSLMTSCLRQLTAGCAVSKSCRWCGVLMESRSAETLHHARHDAADVSTTNIL